LGPFGRFENELCASGSIIVDAQAGGCYGAKQASPVQGEGVYCAVCKGAWFGRGNALNQPGLDQFAQKVVLRTSRRDILKLSVGLTAALGMSATRSHIGRANRATSLTANASALPALPATGVGAQENESAGWKGVVIAGSAAAALFTAKLLRRKSTDQSQDASSSTPSS
jgi:hypothetical protein